MGGGLRCSNNPSKAIGPRLIVLHQHIHPSGGIMAYKHDNLGRKDKSQPLFKKFSPQYKCQEIMIGQYKCQASPVDFHSLSTKCGNVPNLSLKPVELIQMPGNKVLLPMCKGRQDDNHYFTGHVQSDKVGYF